ncbi:MAG: helix-turn-helix domain-containing protein [Fimbriimonadaceae bacterium]|nr:helix-turn-helix domain-containing protein [Fimbriimonadaceae bacterium]
MKQNPGATSALMTIREFSETLRISERTARDLLARGKLPIVRISRGRIALLRRDVDAYIEACRTGGPEGTAA